MHLSRFESTPPHPDRWDMVLFAGGPVWAMEWCPTPDDAPATQYLALSCHQGMEDQHFVNKMYSGTGLIQLWDVGKLECTSRYRLTLYQWVIKYKDSGTQGEARQLDEDRIGAEYESVNKGGEVEVFSPLEDALW